MYKSQEDSSLNLPPFDTCIHIFFKEFLMVNGVNYQTLSYTCTKNSHKKNKIDIDMFCKAADVITGL